jgi:hypothetical protein
MNKLSMDKSNKRETSISRRSWLKTLGVGASLISLESGSVAATSDGYGISGYGAGEYGDPDTGLTVTTDGASDVDETNVTLNGSLTDLGGTSFVDVYFAYRHTNVTTWSATATQTASSAGGFSAAITENRGESLAL